MSNTRKKSIGKLRRNSFRNNPRAPELPGKIGLQRTTFEQIAAHFRQSRDQEIECSIAGSLNVDKGGKYIGIELSPPYCPQRPASIQEMFDDGEPRTADDESRRD
jgi:hypothetical protein